MAGLGRRLVAFLALCLLLALARPAAALHFYLEGGESKCFIEELPKDTNVVGVFPGVSELERRVPDWNPLLVASKERTEPRNSMKISKSTGSTLP
jgi:hypothetical protein